MANDYDIKVGLVPGKVSGHYVSANDGRPIPHDQIGPYGQGAVIAGLQSVGFEVRSQALDGRDVSCLVATDLNPKKAKAALEQQVGGLGNVKAFKRAKGDPK